MAPWTDRYEGPLDLLLDEVRRQEVAIERIAMAPIVARFLEYVRTAAQRNLALDIEWLHMAATLIEWKSRALLPAGPEESPTPDAIRDDLVRQLKAHRQRTAADLELRQSIEGTRFSRGSKEFREAAEAVATAPGFITVWDMTEQARDLGRWVEAHRQARLQWRTAWDIDRDEVSVAAMIEYLRVALGPSTKLDAVTLLERQETASRRACLFLGMLEMARVGEIELQQNEAFGPICLSVSQTRPQ